MIRSFVSSHTQESTEQWQEGKHKYYPIPAPFSPNTGDISLSKAYQKPICTSMPEQRGPKTGGSPNYRLREGNTVSGLLSGLSWQTFSPILGSPWQKLSEASCGLSWVTRHIMALNSIYSYFQWGGGAPYSVYMCVYGNLSAATSELEDLCVHGAATRSSVGVQVNDP